MTLHPRLIRERHDDLPVEIRVSIRRAFLFLDRLDRALQQLRRLYSSSTQQTTRTPDYWCQVPFTDYEQVTPTNDGMDDASLSLSPNTNYIRSLSGFSVVLGVLSASEF